MTDETLVRKLGIDIIGICEKAIQNEENDRIRERVKKEIYYIDEHPLVYASLAITKRMVDRFNKEGIAFYLTPRINLFYCAYLLGIATKEGVETVNDIYSKNNWDVMDCLGTFTQRPVLFMVANDDHQSKALRIAKKEIKGIKEVRTMIKTGESTRLDRRCALFYELVDSKEEYKLVEGRDWQSNAGCFVKIFGRYWMSGIQNVADHGLLQYDHDKSPVFKEKLNIEGLADARDSDRALHWYKARHMSAFKDHYMDAYPKEFIEGVVTNLDNGSGGLAHHLIGLDAKDLEKYCLDGPLDHGAIAKWLLSARKKCVQIELKGDEEQGS